ncbi:MAG TPA: hypothetical protein VFG37_15975 [Planctomycetota bacterium]|nr:hypothetical protein [Planctomycetota bacterium]
MGKLAGVGDVAFDCKTATIRMKGEATLEKAAVETALTGAGCKMGEFTARERPTFAVVTVALKSIDAKEASAATLTQELPRELPELTDVFLEPDGRATLLVREGKALDEAALKAALAKRQLAAEGLATKRWPTSAARKVAVVKGMSGAAVPAKARTAIESIGNVLAAIARPDGGSFVVFTREPCANLEARLREALGAAGLELAGIE